MKATNIEKNILCYYRHSVLHFRFYFKFASLSASVFECSVSYLLSMRVLNDANLVGTFKIHTPTNDTNKSVKLILKQSHLISCR